MEVEGLLRAAWVAWTLPLVGALFQIDAVRRFALHHFVGRGKIMGSSFTIFSVPQKYFSHFYVVGFIFNSILILGLYASLGVGDNGDDDENNNIKIKMNGIWQSILLLVLFEAQLLGRIVESIFIFKYSPTARMHVVSYLLSFYYYSAVSVSLCCKYCVEALEHANNMIAEYLLVGDGGKSADRRGLMNTNMNIWGGIVNPLLQLQWYAWIGAAFFIWGWIHQRRCHAILGSIRKNRKADEYAIPEGDWFQYVSSAHYLAEIVIYGGFVVASGFSDLTIWLLFIFVVANLAVTADETHKWYHRKFDNYPKNRYAIIPFIY